jgi:hypothetical protein
MNSTYTTGAAVKSAKDLSKDSGLSGVASAEYYVNYDPSTKVVKDSWEVQGIISGFTYTNDASQTITTLKAGDEIDADTLAALKAAYNNGNLQAGKYTGTANTAPANTIDVANTYSWTEFKAKYLTYTAGETYGDSFKTSANGTYVKVIDFNGDNTADYVLQVNTVLDQVQKVTSQGATIITTETVNGKTSNVVLSDKNASTAAVALNADVNISDGNELAKGDVILYALVDGTYYTTVVTPVVDTVSAINYKADTFTGAETEYAMSAITNKTDMTDAVADLTKKDTYKLYQDLFGYVAAFVENGAEDYILLTEMYTNATTGNQLISDKTYIAETVNKDGDMVNYTVASGAKTFYDRSSYTGITSAVTNSWTNVAGYSIADDEINLTSAKRTYTYRNAQGLYYTYDNVLALDKSEGVAKGQKTFTITTALNDSQSDGELNVVSDTVVYLVYGTSEGKYTEITDVKVGTGYNFINKVDADAVNAVYAVASTTKSDKNGKTYFVADVLVIEINKDNFETEVALAYQQYQNNTVEAILTTTADTDDLTWTAKYVTNVWFYDYVTNGAVTESNIKYTTNDIYAKITANYGAKGIYAAAANKVNELQDYLEYYAVKDGAVDTSTFKYITDISEQTILTLTTNPNSQKVVVETVEPEDIKATDTLILVYNGKDLSYILVVSTETTALYNAIVKDTAPATTDNLRSVEVLGQKATALEKGTGTKADPFQYEITLCSNATSGASPRLRVLDNDAEAVMELYDQTGNNKIANQTGGVGEVRDPGTTVGSGSKWMVKSADLWYSVKVNLAQYNATVTSKDSNAVKVDGTDIKILVTLGDITNSEEEIQAILDANLTVENGTLVYSKSTGKATLTPDCVDDAGCTTHTATEYTVSFSANLDA